MTVKVPVNLWRRSRADCERAGNCLGTVEQVVSRVDSVWLMADGGRCAQHYE